MPSHVFFMFEIFWLKNECSYDFLLARVSVGIMFLYSFYFSLLFDLNRKFFLYMAVLMPFVIQGFMKCLAFHLETFIKAACV